MSYINLHWDTYSITGAGELVLNGAVFKGPGLKDSYKLLPVDSIYLDFTKYYSGKDLIDRFYVVEFVWEGVNYGDNYSVSFNKATLNNVNFDLFSRIDREVGYIRISLLGHRDVEHYRNFFYESEVREY